MVGTGNGRAGETFNGPIPPSPLHLERGAFWREVLSMGGMGDGRAGETFCESRCPCEMDCSGPRKLDNPPFPHPFPRGDTCLAWL